MLLSSVNFVAKPKTGKSKEKAYKKEERKKEESAPFSCEQCIKEVEQECRIFQFPSTPSRSLENSTSSGYVSENNIDLFGNVGDRVTIVTSDDRCLSVEQFYYTIVLKEESRSDNTCIFRKKILQSKPVSNGTIETVVFALDCDQEFYITTSKHGDLELNYFLDDPSIDKPDERQFLVYHTGIGHCFIQPKVLKNVYLHHLDHDLSVQSLDLNCRCPEEYFFHFNAVPEPIPKKMDIVKVCTHKKECSVQEIESNNGSMCTKSKRQAELDNKLKVKSTETYLSRLKNSCKELPKQDINALMEHQCNTVKQLPEHFEFDISLHKKSKKKEFLTNLFLGCFGAKSHHLTTTKTTLSEV